MTPTSKRGPALGPLATRVASVFPGASRSRGDGYYREGRVQMRVSQDDRVVAWVRGTRMYTVTLEAKGAELGMRCDCPHFDEHGIYCKHLWAVILAADAGKLLAGVAARSRVPIVELEQEEYVPPPSRSRARREEPAPQPPPAPPPMAWRDLAQPLVTDPRHLAPLRREHRREARCVVLLDGSRDTGELVIGCELRSITPRGQARDWRSVSLKEAAANAPPEDGPAFEMLAACRIVSRTYGEASTVAVPLPLAWSVCALLARGGMECELEALDGTRMPLAVDDGGPWGFRLIATEAATEAGAAGDLVVRGVYVRGEERLETTRTRLVFHRHLLILVDRVAALGPVDYPVVSAMMRRGSVRVPAADREAFAAFAAERGDVELPEGMRFEEARDGARFLARFARPDVKEARVGVAAFAVYGDREVALGAPGRAVVDAAARRFHVRDAAAERRAVGELAASGARFASEGGALDLPIAKLARAARALLGAGWRVEGADRRFRGATSTRASVVSGVDWFELSAEVDFDGERVPLPRLLAALRRGESFVELGDGSLGVLPDEWLERWGAVVDLAHARGDAIRFARTQAALLDAIVGATDHAALDESFTKLRARLAEGFRANAEPQVPATFTGTLRDYQRAGVAWMEMLAEAGFGGCLADDMGLGKTVQVLARLAARAGSGPSLVVAPRSLVFNWRDEAARFVPSMRVVDHTGAERKSARDGFAGVDLVLTTYGTLRRDVEALSAVDFDYVILDEAQAIKNDTTSSAKAARSLRARHRLALSGTPIENHLGELWSLFEFLSPGMLGRSTAFKRWSTGAPEGDDRAMLGRALRPFLLRRTKGEVAKELPDRIEQTIACQLDTEQRALYDELRKHYRRTLLAKARKAPGEPLPSMNVLEALLRLRQAACHPGLVDHARADAPSAKMDALFAQLASVLEEGHKAIVFSQFTSLLELVRARLQREGVGYEVLDGGTTAKQRARRVERFQEEADCRVFLVSLKAGGTGLNLTAATYVFLLDPWWNPAAEAQAIDRAHRIGQTRTVLAYRLVAKDTVEERVLALQATKRELASAILEPGAWSVMRELRIEDLDLLLS